MMERRAIDKFEKEFGLTVEELQVGYKGKTKYVFKDKSGNAVFYVYGPMKDFIRFKEAAKPAKTYDDFDGWENDFGFLMMCMQRELNMTIDMNVKIFAAQLEKSTDYVKDADMLEPYTKSVNSVYDMMSDHYKQFLIDKYFGTEKSLITFIAETIYSEIVKAANDVNGTKIKKMATESGIKILNKMNGIKKKGGE